MEYPDEMPPGWVLQERGMTWWGERRMLQRLAALTDEERAVLFEDACRGAYQIHLAGLRDAYPAASERDLELRAAALRIGADRVRRLTGSNSAET